MNILIKILLQSSIAVILTSLVPLLIFFFVGPIVLQSRYQPIVITGLVSVAVGSLLGDVFFHLIPEIFDLKEDSIRSCALMLFGIVIFFVGERFLAHYHHGHGHRHVSIDDEENSLPCDSTSNLASSSPPAFVKLGLNDPDCEEEAHLELDTLVRNNNVEPAQSINTPPSPILHQAHQGQIGPKPMGLLVLTSDFIHNFVDGIAVGISFATSFPVGLATSIAVFLHEIPHELGDFAILLAAGYSPVTIMVCNILTTLSSFIGIFIALLLLYCNKHIDDSILGDPPLVTNPVVASLKPAILAVTAGNFLYIALADLIPELLNPMPFNPEGHDISHSWRKNIHWLQYAGIILGSLSMLFLKLTLD